MTPPVAADALPTPSECPSDPPTPTGPQRGEGGVLRMPRYCPRCGREDKPAPVPCTAERFRWDEDDAGHHCREAGQHTVHTDREHGCRWTEATSGSSDLQARP